jgi:crossover junction endodeoxyribonuclease RusA
MTLNLPYPPSVNSYWKRNRNGSVRVGEAGVAFRKAVWLWCKQNKIKPLSGRLAMSVELYPPDQRRRDIDNPLKATLDALQHGGAYADDCQIDYLSIIRGAVEKGGRMRVIITNSSLSALGIV